MTFFYIELRTQMFSDDVFNNGIPLTVWNGQQKCLYCFGLNPKIDLARRIIHRQKHRLREVGDSVIEFSFQNIVDVEADQSSVY